VDDTDALIAQALEAKRQAAPVFTGAEERAAEERKLAESLNPLERLAIGTGKGMFSTHQNISDVLSNLPGLAGSGPDWDKWNQEQQLYDKTLGQDFFAGFGDLTGQTAMLAPVGGAAGSLTRAAAGALLPRALVAAAPVFAMGADGAAQGALAGGPGNRGGGALAGGTLALGAGALSQGAGAASKALTGVADKARARGMAIGEKEAAAAVASAKGELGAKVQAANRLVENLQRLKATGNATPGQLAQLKRLEPELAELEYKLMESSLKDLPNAAGGVDDARAAFGEMLEGQGDAARAAGERINSGGEAGRQLLSRLKRYALPGIVGAMGGVIGGPLGIGAGALAGRGLSPTAQALWRMTKHPAVASRLADAGASATGAASRAFGLASKASPAMAGAEAPAMAPALSPAFVEEDDTDRLIQEAMVERQAKTRQAAR
jgi:hypothetical protein